MRRVIAIALLLAPSPALAQFPPPGIYACTDEAEAQIGVLGLLVAGDYQWDADGVSTTGQVASAGTSVEALTGPLGEQHWRGRYTDETGATTFVFETDAGTVVCR